MALNICINASNRGLQICRLARVGIGLGCVIARILDMSAPTSRLDRQQNLGRPLLPDSQQRVFFERHDNASASELPSLLHTSNICANIALQQAESAKSEEPSKLFSQARWARRAACLTASAARQRRSSLSMPALTDDEVREGGRRRGPPVKEEQGPSAGDGEDVRFDSHGQIRSFEDSMRRNSR